MATSRQNGPKPQVEVSSPLEKQRDVWVEAQPADPARHNEIGASVWTPEEPLSPYLTDPVEPSLLELASILGVAFLFDGDESDQ